MVAARSSKSAGYRRFHSHNPVAGHQDKSLPNRNRVRTAVSILIFDDRGGGNVNFSPMLLIFFGQVPEVGVGELDLGFDIAISRRIVTRHLLQTPAIIERCSIRRTAPSTFVPSGVLIGPRDPLRRSRNRARCRWGRSLRFVGPFDRNRT